MKIVLDLVNITTKSELFDLLNKKFYFEEECTNLDALYDGLTSKTNEYYIIIKNINDAYKNIGNYINIFKQVLLDCEQECDNIHILYDEVGN